MANSLKKGTLFVISGPSGVGKGTLVSMLRQNHPEIKLSVSATTRNPRPGEINGVHYFFLTKEDFKKRIELGEFLEWAEFSGNFYGTNKNFVEKMLKDGHNIILEIDVQGALQVKNKLQEAILIFIEPPCFEELKLRLLKRSTETEEEIQKRLAVVKSELQQKQEFNYVIVNDNLDTAFKNLENIILKEIDGIKNK
ncbi:MAG TPA: guanylate kinase [Cyanobacteria bacterium UBA9971]|nr:guanylate kinase [Cyanobacteria bacterium UBA9971]